MHAPAGSKTARTTISLFTAVHKAVVQEQLDVTSQLIIGNGIPLLLRAKGLC